jgi:hypothetical protein
MYLHFILKHIFHTKQPVGRDSVVGIATYYGLDGLGMEFRWGGEIFRTRPDKPRSPPSLLQSGY